MIEFLSLLGFMRRIIGWERRMVKLTKFKRINLTNLLEDVNWELVNMVFEEFSGNKNLLLEELLETIHDLLEKEIEEMGENYIKEI